MGVLSILLLAVACCPLAAQDVRKADEHSPAPGRTRRPANTAPPRRRPDPLEAKPELAIWTLAVFVGLFLLLGKFAWKPLLALHQREQHLEHVLEETERARNESEGKLAEHRRLMARAADEVRAILDKAGKKPRPPPIRSSNRPRRRPKRPSSVPSATSPRPATRPWPRSGKRPPTWPSPSRARCWPSS